MTPTKAIRDPTTTILGEAQWRWLGEQLRVPAEVRLLVSSIQVVAEDHGFEKWMNFPHEREKLYTLMRETGAEGVIILSGDRHLAELSMMDAGLGYPIYDLTASAFNQSSRSWRPFETNRHRVATMNWGDNFGLITIDWDQPDPRISLQIRDVDGDITIQQKIRLSTIKRKGVKPARAGHGIAEAIFAESYLFGGAPGSRQRLTRTGLRTLRLRPSPTSPFGPQAPIPARKLKNSSSAPHFASPIQSNLRQNLYALTHAPKVRDNTGRSVFRSAKVGKLRRFSISPRSEDENRLFRSDFPKSQFELRPLTEQFVKTCKLFV